MQSTVDSRQLRVAVGSRQFSLAVISLALVLCAPVGAASRPEGAKDKGAASRPEGAKDKGEASRPEGAKDKTEQQVPKGQMPTLGRPTETGDTVPLLDFDNYFLGKWTFEWSMPESVLGPAGPYSGTTTVTKLDGRFYEAISEGEGPAGTFKIREVIAYHRENKTLARTVTDSRGYSYFQFGPVGGDLGGIYNIHFESAPFTVNGKSVRLRHSLHLLSPLNYRMATGISVEGGPFTNLGTPWWRKAP